MKNRRIILIHGYNGIPQIYDYFAKILTQNGYKVTIPDFPVRNEITVNGYFKVFDQHRSIFENGPIVVAHSIGNEMFLKYIAAHNYKVHLYISLAGFDRPFIVEGRDELNAIINSVDIDKTEITQATKLIKKSYSIYSNNDHIVPFELLQSFCEDIRSESILIPDIGHMGSKSGLTELPEVIEIIHKNEGLA